MKSGSLFKNTVYNLLKTFSSLVFPIVTFAYAARILGEEGVGRVNFAKSIITYFSTFAMLGMNYYGTREAAKLRNDRDRLSKFSHEMLMINAVSSLLAYLFLIVAVVFVKKLQDYASLLAINSIGIFLQAMGMEWLYQGVEKYKYIAIRSMIFQLIALVLMFILVRGRGREEAYAGITVIATTGAYVVNFIDVHKLIDFRRRERYEIKKHLKPLLLFFAMVLSIELYAVLDSTMLGFLKGDVAVGKYTAAIKLNKLSNQVIVSIGIVVLPRMSYLISQKRGDAVKDLAVKAYNIVFMLSIPAMVGLFALSGDILVLFCGEEFLSAEKTMRLMAPIVTLIPFSVITNQFILSALGKEKLILMSTTAGAVSNLISNSFLIPRWAENGAAIGTVIAETIVAIICFHNAKKYLDMSWALKGNWQYWLAAASMIPVICGIRVLKVNYILQIFFAVPIAALVYFAVLYLLGNPYLKSLAERVAIRK